MSLFNICFCDISNSITTRRCETLGHIAEILSYTQIFKFFLPSRISQVEIATILVLNRSWLFVRIANGESLICADRVCVQKHCSTKVRMIQIFCRRGNEAFRLAKRMLDAQKNNWEKRRRLGTLEWRELRVIVDQHTAISCDVRGQTTGRRNSRNTSQFYHGWLRASADDIFLKEAIARSLQV